MQEQNNNLFSKKIKRFLIPAIIIFFSVFIFFGGLFISLYPIIKGGQLIAGVSGFWDRITNALTFKCLFCTDEQLEVKKEQKFYEKIDTLNETYLSGKNMEGTSIQLDIPLLLSTIFKIDNLEDTLFDESDNNEYMEDATSGDFFKNLSWYVDSTDQHSIVWFKGATEKEGCYIAGYNYAPDMTPSNASTLRKLAKHMVRRTVNGTCSATHNKDGVFTGWNTNEWYEYNLSIDREDKTYTMEFDQNPYASYRNKEEANQAPSSYITYLLATYIPLEYKDSLPVIGSVDIEQYLSRKKEVKNIIYSYKSAYEYLVNHNIGAVCGENNGNCSYSVKIDKNKTVDVSNLKVQLLQCKDGTRGEPIPGEELVDFEKYITGVVYAEVGGSSYETLKAQAVAARSYALTRGALMGVKYLKIHQENGQWILPIRNCTEDQVYCDPDQGCSNTTKPSESGNSTTVYSGVTTKAYKYRDPLPADSDIRKAVAETTGQVLVGSNGEIEYTPYTSATQNKWQSQTGNDFYEMLASHYGSDKILKASCTGSVGTTTNSGSEKYYNQNDYAYLPYCSGIDTIATSGSLPTAFAMAVENVTGTVTTPQTVADYICNNTNGSLQYHQSTTSPAFLLDNNTQNHFKILTKSLSMSERNIDNILNSLKNGKNIIASIQGTGLFATNSGNYIVLSSVTPEGNIKVLDPSNRNTTKDYTVAVIQLEVLNKINSGMWEISAVQNNVISDGCYTGATGDYIAWRQEDKTWKDIPLGSGKATIGSAGCLATSVAKLLTMSGTHLTLSSFNPGTMVKYLNTHGGFSGSNWVWDAPVNSGLAPNFVHGGFVNLKGMSRQEKIQKVKQYLDQGYYLVLQVKCDGTEEPGQHWVAVLGVTSNDIVMSDPASNATGVFSKYKPGGSVKFHYYRKLD